MMRRHLRLGCTMRLGGVAVSTVPPCPDAPLRYPLLQRPQSVETLEAPLRLRRWNGGGKESFRQGEISSCVRGIGALCGPPRSNARASGPRGYATTSSVLAIVLVAGSFDRFVNSRPSPNSGGRLAKGGPVR